MKRALAARVKEEMGDPIIPPRAPPSALSMAYNGIAMNGAQGPSSDHPAKLPRTDSGPMAPPVSASPPSLPHSAMGGGMMEIHSLSSTTGSKKRPRSPPNAASSGNASAYQSSQSRNHDENNYSASGAAPKGRPPSRPRKSSGKQDSSDDDDEADSSFYLKHQNSSLASELYAYRRRIYLLEREREFRRRECRVAGHKIGELSGVWRGLEAALGKEFESNELLKQVCTWRAFILSRVIGHSLILVNPLHSVTKGQLSEWGQPLIWSNLYRIRHRRRNR